ncbi:TetR family transcriptional regulator [Aliiglaciecola sp. CAU 1673]|uniref:TetR/AcrR family transcriptional regulator n=1 Tax=Aliiglaciecola sp. CAU 1673 TaxID=3032595 RepID=UPI0023DB848E|nr:TetR family transcriptional regulator [Aliiglaciecola sp. CAU 1673]MDF2179014.1 TetR family transcriptional regulator [Aliiglaciecola sp. CAU 1673]
MQILDNLTLPYEGRITKRRDSLERRNNILQAALRVMVRDGIREVRHRSVAKEAEVPLSATTYYFESIDSLIHDAFVYFTESNLAQIQLLERSAWIALEEYQRHQDRVKLKQNLQHFLVNHIKSQVADRDNRLLEWSFRQEALRDPKLGKLLTTSQQMTQRAVSHFFESLAHPHASARANVLVGTLLQLEYQMLSSALTEDELDTTIALLLSSTLFEL